MISVSTLAPVNGTRGDGRHTFIGKIVDDLVGLRLDLEVQRRPDDEVIDLSRDLDSCLS